MFLTVSCAVVAMADEKTDLVKYVNTLQGTNSNFTITHGNTYPSVTLPFGMHSWSAQTGANGDGWKYQYDRDSIRAFQQAHQCSSWTNDYFVYSLMPVSGTLKVDQYGRAARFSHKNETAKPHYYSVLFDNGTKAEISPVERGAHLRFSFPKGEKAFVVLDGYTGMSSVNIDPKARRITGYVRNGRLLHPGSRNYFVIEFDKPFVSFGTLDNTTGEIFSGRLSDEGKGKGAYIEFAKGTRVQIKTASSYISPAQADLNLTRELSGFKSFDQTKQAAWRIWNKHLSRILVEDDNEENKATFYSCFFRASIFSRKYYDAEGKPYYRSPNDNKIYSGYYYTDTGFWDTFRAQFPLTCILHPTMQGRYMNAMLDCQKQFGWLPSWSFPFEQGGMIGNHAISLFADAWAKGLRTFKPEEVLKAYLHEVTNDGPSNPANGRKGWKEYFTLGYIPYPDVREATAKTLEYTYDDWCAYELARVTGNSYYEEIFKKQIYNYKNVFDASTGFMRGRHKDGTWVENFDPAEWGGPFTEGCAWHYLWSVFHDPEGLATLMGGKTEFGKMLDSVFVVPPIYDDSYYGFRIHEITEMQVANMGNYAHGNQPAQHMIYLYNYVGQPWKAQWWTREVMDRLYSSKPDGYCGDEDNGQTSAWYVFSALGFYPVCPGSDEYAVGSPLFRKAAIHLENGQTVEIDAPQNCAENRYVGRMTVDGKVTGKTFLEYGELLGGAKIAFGMQPEPDKDRGAKPGDAPYSMSREDCR